MKPITTRTGDTLRTLAARLGTSVKQLEVANNLHVDPDAPLKVGLSILPPPPTGKRMSVMGRFTFADTKPSRAATIEAALKPMVDLGRVPRAERDVAWRACMDLASPGFAKKPEPERRRIEGLVDRVADRAEVMSFGHVPGALLDLVAANPRRVPIQRWLDPTKPVTAAATKALDRYRSEGFVSLPYAEKAEVVAALGAIATPDGLDLLARHHLPRLVDGKPIRYAVEVEGGSDKMTRWYEPAGGWSVDGDAARTALVKRWGEKEDPKLVRSETAPPFLADELKWECLPHRPAPKDGYVWEITTLAPETGDPWELASLDRLGVAVEWIEKNAGDEFHVHATFEPTAMDEDRIGALGDLVRGLDTSIALATGRRSDMIDPFNPLARRYDEADHQALVMMLRDGSGTTPALKQKKVAVRTGIYNAEGAMGVEVRTAPPGQQLAYIEQVSDFLAGGLERPDLPAGPIVPTKRRAPAVLREALLARGHDVAEKDLARLCRWPDVDGSVAAPALDWSSLVRDEPGDTLRLGSFRRKLERIQDLDELSNDLPLYRTEIPHAAEALVARASELALERLAAIAKHGGGVFDVKRVTAQFLFALGHATQNS